MNTKVVLLTGNELRHDFFRKFIASDHEISVLATFCESDNNNLNQLVNIDEQNTFRVKHLATRNKTENDFFELFCDNIIDYSNPIYIERGDINHINNVEHIIDLNPDIIISYGCSIIKSELLVHFKGRFINIHLGLSPYYRGSGTNFWPFITKELQFIGTTFMYIDEGIDTGEIIHQIRADINFNDNVHQIGNRLIKNSFEECIKIIKNFNYLKRMPVINFDKKEERYFTKKHFTEDAMIILYENLKHGLVENYIINKVDLEKKYPIITNAFFL